MTPTPDSSELHEQIERYRQIVLRYEALDEQIDGLIMAHGGTSDKMPTEDLRLYRELARERDDLFSEMRAMEHLLDMDDDTESLT